MKARLAILPLACAALSARDVVATDTIRNVNEIKSVNMMDAAPPGVPFDITAWIVHPEVICRESGGAPFFVRDDSGSTTLQKHLSPTNATIRAGDLVRATGRVVLENNGIYAHCHEMARLAHRSPEPPMQLTVEELLSGRHDGRLVTVRGEIRDSFLDDIDNRHLYFSLMDGERSIYMAFSTSDRTLSNRDGIIGATVDATGVWISGQNNGTRRHIGRLLILVGKEPLRIVKARKTDLFSALEITDVKSLMPSEVPLLGRRRVIGTVLAAWQGDQTLVRTDDGSIVRLDLSSQPVPEAGLRIEAVGFPETDLYTVNLTNARWRPTHGRPISPQSPVRLPEGYVRIGDGTPQQMQAAFHGRTVAVEGIVRGLPQSESDRRLILEYEGDLLPIDFSTCPDVITGLSIGCTVEVRGVWVMVTDNWRPNSVFPKVKGAFVVVNSPDDLHVLARPSWWTTGRLLTAIGLLFAGLIGVVMWNRALKAVAERTKKDLRKEVMAHVASDLRVGERTSLAVELHDTIAQNLTGVALEINAANKLIGSDLASAHRHLHTAAKTLSSCRTELKNCLFDLRGNALGQRDMDAAIRLSVAPVIGDAELTVRFNVPRERITDASAHAIIRIVRELASNAVRHGGARKVKVAGAVEAGMLMFSVTDNGCGFAVELAPSIDECHFGLQGIRERVARFKGKMDIESTPGKGTKVSIGLVVGQETIDTGRDVFKSNDNSRSPSIVSRQDLPYT